MSFHVTSSTPPTQSSLPGSDDITRVELDNGIVLLVRTNFNSPSVVINGYLDVGGLFDPDEKLGLADFTASALLRGTAVRDFQGIYDALESVGASLSLGSGTHSTSFSGKALAEDLELLLMLLSEALRQPVFPVEQVERLRAQLLTGLAIRAQDTGEMASLTFDQVVYDGHPYSRPDDCYPATIQAITRQDLIEFHQRCYGPHGMVLTVVGAVQPERAVEILSRLLADWQNPEQPGSPSLPPTIPLGQVVRRHTPISGKSQADILLGVAGPERRSSDFLSASLGNSILGQFGMYGRIGDVVREQAGLAYYAYSGLAGGPGPGPWSISAGVDPANVERAIDLIVAEVGRFVSEPVSDDELEDSRANFIGRLPLSLESNAGVAGALVNLERYQLGLDYYRQYASLLRSITRADILEAAQRYLAPDKLWIAVAGP